MSGHFGSQYVTGVDVSFTNGYMKRKTAQPVFTKIIHARPKLVIIVIM